VIRCARRARSEFQRALHQAAAICAIAAPN